ncbi:hypothetical protein MA16_Dca026891 [Dendrobium catenatum]|uniref:Uncharacterized protein n=1 Tax=Dendrobium catenatum TaxID=906689 RepID=A0A2I0WHX8_9ASPA|nr:hypothetical protein MA16_Dca026891 [Dendrobium catenatum]
MFLRFYIFSKYSREDYYHNLKLKLYYVNKNKNYLNIKLSLLPESHQVATEYSCHPISLAGSLHFFVKLELRTQLHQLRDAAWFAQLVVARTNAYTGEVLPPWYGCREA